MPISKHLFMVGKKIPIWLSHVNYLQLNMSLTDKENVLEGS